MSGKMTRLLDDLELYAKESCYGKLIDTRTAVGAEIERLTRERDSAREALRISELRVREHWPENERLRAALKKLRNEVGGILGTVKPELLAAAGATNVAVLELRYKEANEALSQEPKP